MAKKLKFGIIGASRIFEKQHLQPLMNHPEVDIVAVCDPNLERAETCAKLCHVTQVYDDYQALLARDDIDAVDICTPNAFHSTISIDALRQGKHVFCEKPDAISPEKAYEMMKAAEESGKKLMVMRNNRFVPSFQFLKEFIDSGKMGEVYTGRCGWVRQRGIPGKGGWFTTKDMSGGGPLIDLGVHMIDLAVWLMGHPTPVAVSGATYTKFADDSHKNESGFGEAQQGGTFDVEDLATGFIRFANNATLQIEFSWASNVIEEGSFVELRGTKAGFSWKKGELQLISEDNGELVHTQPTFSEQQHVNGHEENLHHFVDCVLHHADPVFQPQEGVDLIKILAAIYQSAELKREVLLTGEATVAHVEQ
ncbi:Gfo/Idh/MocA family oxidoreductase [Bacillaceae bacterium SIJ1]|uniref:Gfo/Idh/MocA family protein n=1 Tax=Litoribacterium kuwaitense TaxID=1398745 RepID=UPI0013EA1FE5|nr:Gfo/Idh/MocA family oxidoreductase [Litoribacterium kuwaitense]NGP45441.1 Gfo/Idh/MocA family oxidoreductase [Litoribacterium kuwaitense]